MKKILCLMILLFGCGEDPTTGGGQTGEETVGCLPVTSRVLKRDEKSPLGFSGAELISAISLEHVQTMQWAAPFGAPSTELSIKVKELQSFEFVHYEWIDNRKGSIQSEIGFDCADQVEVGVSVELSTEDGALNEKDTTRLVARSLDEVQLLISKGGDAYKGSIDFSTFGPPEDIQSSINISFLEGTSEGTFDGILSEVQGDVVSGKSLSFGSWSSRENTEFSRNPGSVEKN